MAGFQYLDILILYHLHRCYLIPHHKEIGERCQNQHLAVVLTYATHSGFLKAKLLFHNAERMFNFSSHMGFGSFIPCLYGNAGEAEFLLLPSLVIFSWQGRDG